MFSIECPVNNNRYGLYFDTIFNMTNVDFQT